MTKRWAIGWRGTITRDRGTAYIDAETAQKAVLIYEGNYPTRRVTNVYQVAGSSPPDTPANQ